MARTRLENHKMVEKVVKPKIPKVSKAVSPKKSLQRPHKRK